MSLLEVIIAMALLMLSFSVLLRGEQCLLRLAARTNSVLEWLTLRDKVEAKLRLSLYRQRDDLSGRPVSVVIEEAGSIIDANCDSDYLSESFHYYVCTIAERQEYPAATPISKTRSAKNISLRIPR